MRKKILVLGLAMAMCLGITACGGSTDTASDTEATTETSASEEETTEAAEDKEEAAEEKEETPADATLYADWLYATIPTGYKLDESDPSSDYVMFATEGDVYKTIWIKKSVEGSAKDAADGDIAEHEEWKLLDTVDLGGYTWYPVSFMYGDSPKNYIYADIDGGHLEVQTFNVTIDDQELKDFLASVSIK